MTGILRPLTEELSSEYFGVVIVLQSSSLEVIGRRQTDSYYVKSEVVRRVLLPYRCFYGTSTKIGTRVKVP